MNREKLEKVESLLKDARSNLSDAISREKGCEGTVMYNREAYLNSFQKTCERFGVEVELQEQESDKDDVYSEWSDTVNMSASELRRWSKNPCSRQASVDPASVIKRNLRLLEKNKEDWTSNDVEDAERTISFINRMKANRPDSPREGPHGCPSKWAISLLNWAWNPFDSVPTPSSEVKDNLDAVEEVALREVENRQVSYEFEPVPDQVLYSDRERAMVRAENLGLTGVHEHEFGPENVTMYMPGDTHSEWVEKVKPGVENSEELEEERKASEVFHSKEQERLKEEKESEGVEVPPVAIHKVQGGETNVSEDVEEVLDELWSENQQDEKQ